ncbi:class F sortase [Microlunatus kandeliicorticis]|nr:class F sortase [Microlunatus kandeliicorticis]
MQSGCAGPQSAAPAPAAPSVRSSANASSTPAEPSPEPVREGRPARPNLAFRPTRIELPGGSSAAVVPAATVNGVLSVPENVQHVGWWDGSALVGDPYGATVIAGHIDSATEGLGFFSRLLSLRTGEQVVVRGAAATDAPDATVRHAAFRITSVRTVAKDALSSDSQAFEQDGPRRLVLITCAGAYLPSRGGYQSNLVVVAEPLG